MKLIIRLAATSAVATWATAGMAFFDGEVFYGSKTSNVKYTTAGTEKTKALKGTEMGATFLLDPIPLVPVAFGVTVSQGTTDLKDAAQLAADDNATRGDIAGFSATGTGTSKTMFYGPVIKVWVPMPKIQPYLKAGYLMGTEVEDQSYTYSSPAGSAFAASIVDKPKLAYTHTATEITAGIGFSPVKLTSIFAEYSMHSGKRKVKSLSGEVDMDVGGNTSSGAYATSDLSDDQKKAKTSDSKSIRFGVSAGI